MSFIFGLEGGPPPHPDSYREIEGFLNLCKCVAHLHAILAYDAGFKFFICKDFIQSRTKFIRRLILNTTIEQKNPDKNTLSGVLS